MSKRTIGSWFALFCWVAIIVCFIAGTWGGRRSLLPLVPSLVVLYIVSAARVRHKRTSN